MVYKILLIFILTSHTVHHMGFTDSDTLLSYWFSSSVRSFCLEVMNKPSEILSLLIPQCSSISLLSDLSTFQTTQQLTPFILIALTIAKTITLLIWKDRTKLSMNHGASLLTEHFNLRKLRAVLHEKTTHFQNTFLQSLQCRSLVTDELTVIL